METPEGTIIEALVQYYGPIAFGVVAVVALTLLFLRVWKTAIQPNLDISREQSKDLIQVSQNLKETAAYSDRSLERIQRLESKLEGASQ